MEKATSIRTLLLAGFVLSPIAAWPQSQVCPSATGRSVAATGTGRVRLPPDTVSFAVGVETQGSSIPDALRDNTKKVQAVLSALKAAGVPAAEMQTSDLRIRPREEGGKRLPGFVVENQVAVTREDPASVGQLLQAAFDAGANQAEGPYFFVQEQTTVRDRAFALAFDDARSRATKLASLVGKRLGKVICVAEGGYPQAGGLSEMITVTAAPPVETGLEEVSLTVSAIFELE